jgi:hypothetical protein
VVSQIRLIPDLIVIDLTAVAFRESGGEGGEPIDPLTDVVGRSRGIVFEDGDQPQLRVAG